MDTDTKRRRLVLGALAATCALVRTPPAVAAAGPEGWPSRPVRIVLPTPAGGLSDIIVRIIAEHYTKAFGQPFLVDNKPGANGTIASMAVVKAPPDGLTLLFTNASATTVMRAMNPNLGYDVLRDLVPVAQVGISGQFLVVAPDVPVRNLKEFVELVRANPDKYSYATIGNGSLGHLATAALQHQHGLKITHVPYKGGNEVVQAIVGGFVPMGWVDVVSSIAPIRAGKLRPIAISGTYRAPANPDVPTMAEQGYALNLNGWIGFFAPVGTPPAVVRALNAELNKLLDTTEMKQRLLQMNVATKSLTMNTPEQFGEMLRDQLETMTSIVAANGIKME